MPLLAGHTVLVVDTETTGFKVEEGARLLEVAVAPIVNGEPGDGWASLVRPGIPIPPGATTVHGITDAMVAGAPTVTEVGLRLRAACADLPLVFHNAPFDLPFLLAMFREAGAPMLLNPVIDTLGLARGLPGAGSNRLEDVAKREGVPIRRSGRAPAAAAGSQGKEHIADDDVIMTAHVLLKLAARWERERGVHSLLELAAISQDVMRTTARR